MGGRGGPRPDIWVRVIVVMRREIIMWNIIMFVVVCRIFIYLSPKRCGIEMWDRIKSDRKGKSIYRLRQEKMMPRKKLQDWWSSGSYKRNFRIH